MKKLFFIAGIFLATYSFGQTLKTAHTKNNDNPVQPVPATLVTNDSTWWTISNLSTIGYVNTTAGAGYNSYKSGGGMIVQFRFTKDNHFEFLLYIQANTYGTDTETWTQFDGTVTFTKDTKGQPVFITRAEKGTYRITKNGYTTTRPIPENELRDQHSNTYLWEVTMFNDDPKNIYLLTVDLDAHSQFDINDPKTIDPSWVSKFHIPAEK